MTLSGLTAFLGEESMAEHTAASMRAMGLRGTAGYFTWSQTRGHAYTRVEPEPPQSPLVIAGCLRKKTYLTGSTFLHGSFYGANPVAALPSQGNIEEIKELSISLGAADGSYAFVAPWSGGLVFARDPMGQKPLFYQRHAGYLGLASAVNALPVPAEASPVEPGILYYADLGGEVRLPLSKPFSLSRPQGNLGEAATGILDLLKESLEKRVRGGGVAVGFSGGLDSSLMAFLLSQRCRVRAFSVYVEGSRDAAEAEKSADMIGVDFTGIPVGVEEVDRAIHTVIRLTGASGAMDLSIATAIYFTARKACEEGFGDLFLGQLADELFGGYARYLRVLKTVGEDEANRVMEEDVWNAGRNNFERDEAASSPFVDLVLPYAYLPLVEYAKRLPVRCKLDPDSGERKIVLRRAAAEAGLPVEIYSKPKKAVQHSSGLQKTVSKFV